MTISAQYQAPPPFLYIEEKEPILNEYDQPLDTFDWEETKTPQQKKEFDTTSYCGRTWVQTLSLKTGKMKSSLYYCHKRDCPLCEKRVLKRYQRRLATASEQCKKDGAGLYVHYDLDRKEAKKMCKHNESFLYLRIPQENTTTIVILKEWYSIDAPNYPAFDLGRAINNRTSDGRQGQRITGKLGVKPKKPQEKKGKSKGGFLIQVAHIQIRGAKGQDKSDTTKISRDVLNELGEPTTDTIEHCQESVTLYEQLYRLRLGQAGYGVHVLGYGKQKIEPKRIVWGYWEKADFWIPKDNIT